MKPGRLIFWAIAAVLIIKMFGYVRMHTQPDVISYKRFARAVLDGDDFAARDASVNGVAPLIFESQSKRMERFRHLDIVFTYYDIEERRVSEDGNTVYIIADQVSRVNPKGVSKIWGDHSLRLRQSAKVVLQNDAWLVAEFSDHATK